MMKKTMNDTLRRIRNEKIRKVAYSLPIVKKDMIQNDENVRKFFASLPR